MTTFAIEKRVKWRTLSNIINIWEWYYNKYVKLIVLLDNNTKINEDRISAKESTKSYKNVDDLFIQELWTNVYNKVIK